MIQNSRSPVVKSRISSSSGRTMSVEKRSLAWTGITSSFAYFTTRAPSGSANSCEAEPRASPASKTHSVRVRTTREDRDFIGGSPCLELMLRISVVKPRGNRLRQEHQPSDQHTHGEREEHGGCTALIRQFPPFQGHACPPAKTSRPFSKP